MSEFEFNEDRNDFEVLEDFVFDGGNNNNNSKRIVKEANEAPILKKKTKRRGAEAMYTPIVTFETKSELDNYLKESKEWGYSYSNKGYYGKKAYYHCKHSNYKIQPHCEAGIMVQHHPNGSFIVNKKEVDHTLHNESKRGILSNSIKFLLNVFIFVLYRYRSNRR